MDTAIVSEEMSALVSHFVDSFEIDCEHAKGCLEKCPPSAGVALVRERDPFILMAYACMHYGCMRYTEALHCLRNAKDLFVRVDNPLHFDALGVLEVMSLRALSRIPQALECAHVHLVDAKGDARRMLNMLCVQMYRIQGLYEDAHLLIDVLSVQETDEYAQGWLHLMEMLCKRDQTGDHQAFCAGVSPLYWRFLNEAAHSETSQRLLGLYGAELAYSYAWQGRMDLTSAVLREAKEQKVAQASISYTAACALDQGTRQKYDEALENLSDDCLRFPGVTLEETFVASVMRLIVLHLAGHKREALPLAVKLSEYARNNQALDMAPCAHLLLVSVFLWMYDFVQAQTLLDLVMQQHDDSTARRPHEWAMCGCLNALIAAHDKNHVRAHALLDEARSAIGDPNASLAIAALCAVHPMLLGLIADALDVDAIPSNLTELLDYARYHEAVSTSLQMLSKEQSALLQRRFTRVDVGIAALRREQEKPVVICLFGGLALSVHGTQIDLSRWTRSKAHQLFLRTVLEQGSDLPRDATFALFWADMPRDCAANNYYVTLHKMCTFLEETCRPGKGVEIISRATCGKIRLNTLLCESDIGHFDIESILARKAVLEHDYTAALQHYYRMVELYRGDLLVGDYDYLWLTSYRERYRKQFIDSMISAGEICLKLGQPGETHFFIDAALRHDPGKEAFYEMSLKAYKAMGRREDALNAYYECVDYLQETLGLDPSPGFQKLFNELLTS